MIDKLGIIKCTLLMTVFSVLLSLLITWLSVIVFNRPNLKLSLTVGAIIPLFVAPVFSYFLFALVDKINKKSTELKKSNRKLEKALAAIKELNGLLPICSLCKKIRDDKGYWNQIDQYITKHTNTMFSHSLCPSCYEIEKTRMDEFLDDQKKLKK